MRLLILDVADIPPALLERACRKWVRASRFMPKASELIDLCREIHSQEAAGGIDQLQRHCDDLNAREHGGRVWFITGEAPNRRIEVRQRQEGAAA